MPEISEIIQQMIERGFEKDSVFIQALEELRVQSSGQMLVICPKPCDKKCDHKEPHEMNDRCHLPNCTHEKSLMCIPYLKKSSCDQLYPLNEVYNKFKHLDQPLTEMTAPEGDFGYWIAGELWRAIKGEIALHRSQNDTERAILHELLEEFKRVDKEGGFRPWNVGHIEQLINEFASRERR